jgi:chorismate mutase / prephenate dehydratase
LDDRVGILVDILGEFSRRGINIVDMRTENDIKTQKLRIYLEAEGHIRNDNMASAIAHIETRVIQQRGAIRLLGSFPRIDMRTKYIKSFGFIGTGAMSTWFARRLENEGYEVAAERPHHPAAAGRDDCPGRCGGGLRTHLGHLGHGPPIRIPDRRR